jgi:hypothetical protein
MRNLAHTAIARSKSGSKIRFKRRDNDFRLSELRDGKNGNTGRSHGRAAQALLDQSVVGPPSGENRLLVVNQIHQAAACQDPGPIKAEQPLRGARFPSPARTSLTLYAARRFSFWPGRIPNAVRNLKMAEL